jgi:hypothetical protein
MRLGVPVGVPVGVPTRVLKQQKYLTLIDLISLSPVFLTKRSSSDSRNFFKMTIRSFSWKMRGKIFSTFSFVKTDCVRIEFIYCDNFRGIYTGNDSMLHRVVRRRATQLCRIDPNFGCMVPNDTVRHENNLPCKHAGLYICSISIAPME